MAEEFWILSQIHPSGDRPIAQVFTNLEVPFDVEVAVVAFSEANLCSNLRISSSFSFDCLEDFTEAELWREDIFWQTGSLMSPRNDDKSQDEWQGGSSSLNSPRKLSNIRNYYHSS